MSLGHYPYEVLFEIQGITSRLLARFTRDQIVKSFSGVVQVLADFKRSHPDQIPKKAISGGLLSMGPVSVPINDFELAQHLVDTNDPAMANVINESDGVTVLIAYLEVLANNKYLPDEYLLESALPFAVETLAIEGEEAKRWRLELKIRSDSAAKLMSERNAGNASMPRPNARVIDHEEVLRDFKHLIREGHTEREARGVLVQRRNMGSQSQIYRITKKSSR